MGRWILFRLEIKKFIRMLPVILAETILFGLLLLVFGLWASKGLYGNKAVSQIRIGIVSDTDDRITDRIVRFVSSMDSVSDAVSFVRLSEEEARKKISLGEIFGAVLIPQGLMESILSGENLPAVILLDDTFSSMETAVFAQLADAGAKLLATAQAGIYAADAFCMSTGHEDLIVQSEEYLNKAYIDYAMKRTSLWKEREITAHLGVNISDYYGISLFLAFLLLAGVSFGTYMQVGCGERERIWKTWGIGTGQRYLIEGTAFGAVYSLLGMLLAIPFYLLLAKELDSSFSPSLSWLWMAAVWMAAGLFLRMLVELSGNHTGGMGICFLLLLAFMIVSGMFIPLSFLPLWAERAGRLLPFGRWMEAITAALQGSALGTQAVWLLADMLVYLLLGVLFTKCREHQGMKKHYFAFLSAQNGKTEKGRRE